MGQEPIHKLLAKSAMPAVIGMLLQSIYTMIDGIFVGQGTGPLGLAAVNLSMPVLLLGTAIAFMLVTGGSTYTAIALGEENHKKKLMKHSAWSAGLFSLPPLALHSSDL